AGTTNAGVVDPISQCRQVADQYNLWMHTDAAWGGALIASDALRTTLAGLERSDSVTIDAHKWFATTMGTGMFLTRRAGVLRRVFNVQTDYMPSNDHSVDWYVTSSQWSRRFIGLRLFLSLAVAGWPGYAQHVERAVELTNYLCVQVKKRGWRVVNDSQMAVACLVPPSGLATPDQIVERVVAAGQHWISVTRFEHQPVIRVCITNGKTTQADVDSLVDAMVAAAAT
ncbi:MAG: pyridoxal-dependent decarboxylase, partial [Pseudomonadota bacterium]